MRIPSILISVALLLVVGSVSAYAHAMLDHAEPQVDSTVNAAPREVSLTFTENLEPAFSTMEVTGPSGQRVDDEMFARVRKHFSEDETVELVAIAGYENMRSKMNVALGIEAQGFCVLK